MTFYGSLCFSVQAIGFMFTSVHQDLLKATWKSIRIRLASSYEVTRAMLVDNVQGSYRDTLCCFFFFFSLSTQGKNKNTERSIYPTWWALSWLYIIML